MNDDILIREFRPEDAGRIARLHKESENCFEEMDVDEDFIFHVAARSDYKFFVAEASGNLVGFCGVLFFTSFGRAEVGPIAVDSEFRRRRVASKLLETVIRFLCAGGIRRVTAKAKSCNAGSINFFLAGGFAREGCFKAYTTRSEDVLQLVRFPDSSGFLS